jgi:hypothetical protein
MEIYRKASISKETGNPSPKQSNIAQKVSVQFHSKFQQLHEFSEVSSIEARKTPQTKITITTKSYLALKLSILFLASFQYHRPIKASPL